MIGALIAFIGGFGLIGYLILHFNDGDDWDDFQINYSARGHDHDMMDHREDER